MNQFLTFPLTNLLYCLSPSTMSLWLRPIGCHHYAAPVSNICLTQFKQTSLFGLMASQRPFFCGWVRAACSSSLTQQADRVLQSATGATNYRASTFAGLFSLTEQPFKFSASVFGAAKCAPKCKIQQPIITTAPVRSSVSLAMSLWWCSHQVTCLSSLTLARSLALHCSPRRYLSSTRLPLNMDHLTQTFKSVSESSSDNDQDSGVESSLPSLSESGHKQFRMLNSDCKYLKAPSEKKVYRIIVEGNIGSGKTTFLKIFAKNCNSVLNKPLIVPEPINLWRDVGGVNIFQLLADNPKRWSFAFQSYVQLTMIKVNHCFFY